MTVINLIPFRIHHRLRRSTPSGRGSGQVLGQPQAQAKEDNERRPIQ